MTIIHFNSALRHLEKYLIFTIKAGVIKVESYPGFVPMADLCAIQIVAFIPSVRYTK